MFLIKKAKLSFKTSSPLSILDKIMDPIEANVFHDFEAIYDMNPIQENTHYDFQARSWENPLMVSTPFELLKVYGTKKKRLHVEENVAKQNISGAFWLETGSTISIMKLARSRLLQLKSENIDVLSILCKTHCKSQSGQLNFEEEIELGMALQASAEQVSKKRFVAAKKLLNMCQSSASKTGTSLQRVVFYFAEALEQKMDQEWGFIAPERMVAKATKPLDVLQTLITLLPDRMSCEQKFATSIVCQYTSIQSILENVASSKRVHLIDFRIKNGSHWTLLIQALAVRYECPIELLKITAIGTSKELLEETGKWLSSFAMTMNVPFYYNIVLSELKEIKNEMFQIEVDETLTVYSSVCLWSVLAWPNDLEKLIDVIKGLNPGLLVTHEIDASLNSPDFMERFTQTLFHLSVLFDGLVLSFENHPYRKLTEEIHHRDRIRNTILCDGTERSYRHESAIFWRALFARYGFVEAELSPSALSQANLLLDRSANRSLVYLETDGKCLTSGWNGTPLEFVTTWKLH